MGFLNMMSKKIGLSLINFSTASLLFFSTAIAYCAKISIQFKKQLSSSQNPCKNFSTSNKFAQAKGVPAFGSKYFKSGYAMIPLIYSLLYCRVKMIPHDQKKEKGGQDSYLIAQEQDNFTLIDILLSFIGVADGVGGWAEIGIDPAIYSNKFCKVTKQYHLQNNRDAQNQPKFQKTLGEIIYHTSQVVTEKGSCTIIFATLDPNNDIMKTANFGDCGYMLLRKDKQTKQLKIIFRSKEMQKSFNFPYQVGYKDSGDNLKHLVTKDHDIQKNDVIVMGSDGLFDNAFDKQLLEIVARYVQTQDQIQEPSIVAEALADKAYEFSKMKNRDSPFAIQSGYFSGGKEDDITVMVAQIKLNDNKE